jgi:hypothetical protein
VAAGPHGVGAYGLALSGVDSAARSLVQAEPEWPTYTLVNTIGQVERLMDRLGDDRAELRLRSGGTILVDRSEARAEFVTPKALTADELVHPYLAPVAAVAARWLGRDSFHGGAFALAGDVWGLLADREGGKSTTLAWIAAQGLPVVCDDMLVLEDGKPHAGPRVLDLRAEAAERLSAGNYLGIVGARERWRLELGEVPHGCRFRGWIFLVWGDDVAVEPVPASQRLPRLSEHLGLRVPPLSPERFLDLAALPAREFRRPRGWDRFEEAGSTLLETLRG